MATIPLDAILRELDRVRFLKLDAEGAEFPILLTAHELDRVGEINGEYHTLDDAGMGLIVEDARVGHERYSEELLARRLTGAGFEVVELTPDAFGRGLFSARRPAEPAGRGSRQAVDIPKRVNDAPGRDLGPGPAGRPAALDGR